ncbi:hypothetical protein [Winogradskyella sp. 3972H.M.0a.05]|uniref:hypothetical protein n=1 Tax=Winogradskyella sp. 3972H.M.0a.05 TaxID=2950277 RepID=UPI0033912745
MINLKKSNKKAIKYWELKASRNEASSNIFKGVFILNIIIAVIAFLIGIVNGLLNNDEGVIYLISFLIGLTLLFILVRAEIRKSIIKIENKKSNIPYNKKESFSLDLLFMSIRRSIRFNLDSINIYINTKDFSIGPSVFKGKNKNTLIIPIGFVKFYRKNQDIAKSILIHEFGHILQKDTTHLKLIAAYQAGYLKKMVPITFILLCAIIVISIFNLISISNELSVHKSALFTGNSDFSYYSNTSSYLSKSKALMILSIMQNSFTLLSIFITVFWIRKIRINSEHLADVFAFIHCGENSVFEAFKYSSQTKVSFFEKLLGIQPSLSLRNKKLKKIIKTLNKFETKK